MMPRDKSLQALADAGFPTDAINDQVNDQLLEQMVEFISKQGQAAPEGDESMELPPEAEGLGDEEMGDELPMDDEMGDEEMDLESDEEEFDPSMEDEDYDPSMDDAEYEDEDEDYDPDLEEFMDGLDNEDEDMEMYEEIGDGINPKSDTSSSSFFVGNAGTSKPHPKKVSITRQYKEKDKLVFTIDQVRKIVQSELDKKGVAVATSERIDKFCDRMVSEGKMLPGQVEAQKYLLHQVAKVNEVHKFGEKKITALQKAMADIEAGPKLLMFGDRFAQSMDAQGRMSDERKQKLLSHTMTGQQVLKNNKS